MTMDLRTIMVEHVTSTIISSACVSIDFRDKVAQGGPAQIVSDRGEIVLFATMDGFGSALGTAFGALLLVPTGEFCGPARCGAARPPSLHLRRRRHRSRCPRWLGT
jgi:hypothetical protein